MNDNMNKCQKSVVNSLYTVNCIPDIDSLVCQVQILSEEQSMKCDFSTLINYFFYKFQNAPNAMFSGERNNIAGWNQNQNWWWLRSSWNQRTAFSWWCHHMEILSASLAICEGNPPATGWIPHKGLVMIPCCFICYPEQAVEQAFKLPVNCDVMMRWPYHCNVFTKYCKISNIRCTKSQNLNGPHPVLQFSLLIHWSQWLSREWRCSWSSADRWCSNYIWVINDFIAH